MATRGKKMLIFLNSSKIRKIRYRSYKRKKTKVEHFDRNYDSIVTKKKLNSELLY